MDCDGPKHALVRDMDGTLLGSSPVESSIIPFAELRCVVTTEFSLLHSYTTDLMRVVLQRHGLLMLVHWIGTLHQM